MNKKERTLGIILSAFLLCSGSLVGCNRSEGTVTENTGSNVTYNGDAVYPITCDDTLTLWMEMNPNVATTTSNFGTTAIAQELAKKTGVKIEYLHPASGMVAEQFNLLLTSNDLPDIIRYNWHDYGVEKAEKEGYILNLNDVLGKWAPNLKKVFDDNSSIAKQVRTDEGNYGVFPFIRGDESLCVYSGPIIRKDWLEKLNMEVPETIDEWEVMLRRFKTELGASIPLSIGSTQYFNQGFLTGAYGVIDDYYVDEDGLVQYGPAQNQYKDFLVRMNRWFNEGLLDNNFATTDYKIFNGNFLNENTGATCGYAVSAIGTLLDSASNIEGFDLVGASYPVLNKGDRPMFSQRDWQYTYIAAWAISAQCKNPELAARFLDYGYSEEGQRVYNFGIEDKSFELSNGEPELTDFIKNNPDGEPMRQMITLYSMASYSAPSVQNKKIVETSRPYKQQNEAVAIWKDTDAEKHILPVITLSEEEREELSGALTEINTYRLEKEYAFIMNEQSIDEFDSYVEQLNELGLDRVLKIYNAAVKRYQKR